MAGRPALSFATIRSAISSYMRIVEYRILLGLMTLRPVFGATLGPRNGVVEKNFIYNINQPTDLSRNQHESQGIFIEAGCSGWTVRNNVIYNIGGAGIRQRMNRSGYAANQYLNNTIYNIGYNAIQFGATGNGSASVIKNNIVMNAGESQIHFVFSRTG